MFDHTLGHKTRSHPDIPTGTEDETRLVVRYRYRRQGWFGDHCRSLSRRRWDHVGASVGDGVRVPFQGSQTRPDSSLPDTEGTSLDKTIKS